MAALEMLARELNSHCCSQLLNTYKLGKMINSSCQNLLQQWLQLGAALLAGLAGRCTKGAFPSLRVGHRGSTAPKEAHASHRQQPANLRVDGFSPALTLRH